MRAVIFSALAAASLIACTPRETVVDVANKALSDLDTTDRTNVAPERRLNLLQLYSDRPDIQAVIAKENITPVFPRARSMAMPPYVSLRSFSGEAPIRVAFVVDEAGTVREPRILESEGTRYDWDAVAAVQRWAFTPGTVNGLPSKFVLIVPFYFEARTR